MFNNIEALKLFFLIAPALYLVNTIVAVAFVAKYKFDSIYKINALVWFFYLVLGVSQGALQESDIYVKTFFFTGASFLVVESMSLFAADIFKIKRQIKLDTGLFFLSLISTYILFNTIDNFFLAASPAVFFAAFPVLRLLPLLKSFGSNSFSKNGYLFFAFVIAIHILDYAYAANKPELMFPGYLLALMLATGVSCFTFAVLIERAIMEVEIKDLLHNTSRLTALGGMAAEIAHEVRNPLTVLSLNNNQLKQKLAVGRVDEVYLKNKIELTDRMLKRLVAIMDALKANYQSGEQDDYVSVSIAEILKEAMILCEVRTHKLNIKLIFENKIGDILIVCRSVQITQVLQNLILNAVDALENCKEKWIKVEVSNGAEQKIEISVSDSGPGIAPEIRHKIFNTLFTTKTNGKGTGLGLSISKRFIEEHGGSLKLDQNTRITKFIIELPVNQKTKDISTEVAKKVS